MHVLSSELTRYPNLKCDTLQINTNCKSDDYSIYIDTSIFDKNALKINVKCFFG